MLERIEKSYSGAFLPNSGRVITPYHERAGTSKAGQAGCGGASRAQDATDLALPYLISPQFPPGGCKTVTEKTSAAAAAADAGLVFYNYGGHRIIHEIEIKNRPAPRAVRGALLASAGRNFIDLRQFS